MQLILSNTDYSYVASTKKITLVAPFDVLTTEQIYHIVNLTTRAVIYVSGRNRFPISMAAGVITHTYDSTGMADADKLQISVDDGTSAGGSGGLDTTINTETLSGTKTLVADDDGIQWLDPGGADRDVVLPAEAVSEDAMFVIVNTSDGAGEELVAKNDGGTAILTLGAGMGGMFGCDTTDWKIENESGVFYDKITSKVGIGTITPTRMLDVAGNIGIPTDGYLNFGAGDGASGYGIFDNSGVIQHKDSGGAWRDMQIPEIFFVTGTPSVLVGVEGDIAIDEDTGTLWQKENVVTSTTWNPLDKSTKITLSNGDLTAAKNASGVGSVKSVIGVSSGLWYWEIKIDVNYNNERYNSAGIGSSSASLAVKPGDDAHGYGYWGRDGDKYHSAVGSNFGAQYYNSTIGIALDMDAGEIWWSKDGVWQASGDPSTGANPAFTGISGTFYAMFGAYSNTNQATANFGATAFTHTVPTGFASGLGGAAVQWVKKSEPTFVMLPDTPSSYTDADGKLLKATSNSVEFVEDDYSEIFFVSGTPSGAVGVLGDIAIDEDTGTLWQKEDVIAPTTWNPADKDGNITLSGSDLIATKVISAGVSGVRSITNKSAGKWYFEITVGSGYANLGIGTSSAPLNAELGSDAHSYSFWGANGRIYHNGLNYAYGSIFTSGVIGFAIDLDAGKIWWARNGVWQNSGNPAGGTNEAFSGISGTFYAMFSSYQLNGQVTANFGASAFAYTAPTGFSSGFGGESVQWVKKSEPDFLKLADTPSSYSGADGKTLKATPTGVAFVPDLFAEMYLLDNTTASVIDTADEWHVLSLTEITAGLLSGWTYADGTRGTDITAYATSDAGARTKVTTTAAHNLAAGDFISITGTTNYNDLYEVMEAVDSTNFTIDKAWDTNNDATGTYARGGTLTAGADAAGIYRAIWETTITPATNNHVFTMGFLIGDVPCDKCRSRQKLGIVGDYQVMGGPALLTIVAGDKLAFMIENIGATGNATILYGNVNINRV